MLVLSARNEWSSFHCVEVNCCEIDISLNFAFIKQCFFLPGKSFSTSQTSSYLDIWDFLLKSIVIPDKAILWNQVLHL